VDGSGVGRALAHRVLELCHDVGEERVGPLLPHEADPAPRLPAEHHVLHPVGHRWLRARAPREGILDDAEPLGYPGVADRLGGLLDPAVVVDGPEALRDADQRDDHEDRDGLERD
jgi:hypothetical protein